MYDRIRIHPTALIKKQITYIPGCDHISGDIGDGCFIGCNITLENRVHIAPHVTMIGKGLVYLSEGVTIAPGVVIYTSMPDMHEKHVNRYGKTHKSIQADVHLGRNVFIGANSVIGIGVVIGKNVRIPPLTHIRPYTNITR